MWPPHRDWFCWESCKNCVASLCGRLAAKKDGAMHRSLECQEAGCIPLLVQDQTATVLVHTMDQAGKKGKYLRQQNTEKIPQRDPLQETPDHITLINKASAAFFQLPAPSDEITIGCSTVRPASWRSWVAHEFMYIFTPSSSYDFCATIFITENSKERLATQSGWNSQDFSHQHTETKALHTNQKKKCQANQYLESNFCFSHRASNKATRLFLTNQ